MKYSVKYLALVLGCMTILIRGDARSHEGYDAFGTRCSVYMEAYDKAVQKSNADQTIPFDRNFETYWGFIAGWIPNLFNAPRYAGLDVMGLTAWIAYECRDRPDADLTDIMTILTNRPYRNLPWLR